MNVLLAESEKVRDGGGTVARRGALALVRCEAALLAQQSIPKRGFRVSG